MNDPLIYFDNAATTYPKPESVYESVDNYLRLSGNPQRGHHDLSLKSARAIFEARLLIAGFLGVREPERLVFTGGCTQSINIALRGFGFKKGDLVITTALEHNAVMRPLKQLESEIGIRIVTLPYAKRGIVDAAELDGVLRELKPRLAVFAEASNVTGELLDVKTVSEICREHQLPVMLDAAQSAPWSHGYVSDLGISIWCGASHKGLLGIPGAGLLYVSPDVNLKPLIAGGTGSNSEDFAMPESYPDHLEAGTLPGPAIMSIAAGISWLASARVSSVCAHELKLAEYFLAWAERQDFITIYGPGSGGVRVGIVAFNIKNVTPDVVADMLDKNWNIAVRSGLQCAALAHQTMGTSRTGVVRISFGYFNTLEQVDLLCQALAAISTNPVTAAVQS